MIGVLAARDLLVLARRTAGMSQDALAERMSRPRSTIARWELGEMEPSYDAVITAIDACGLAIPMRFARADASYQYDVGVHRRLDPVQRLRLLGHDVQREAVHAVAQRAPTSVIIGDVASALVGWPLVLPATVTVELCPAPPEQHVVDAIDGIDLTDEPPGTRGWQDLRRHARAVEFDGSTVQVACPLDLLRIERARGRSLQALGVEAVVIHERRWPDGPPEPRQYTDAEARGKIDEWLAHQQTLAATRSSAR